MSSKSISRSLLTVKQLHRKHNAFPEAGLRYYIFHAKPRKNSRGEIIPGNGLLEAGAILWIGRKVLIDEDRFLAWLESQQSYKDLTSLSVQSGSTMPASCHERC